MINKRFRLKGVQGSFPRLVPCGPRAWTALAEHPGQTEKASPLQAHN